MEYAINIKETLSRTIILLWKQMIYAKLFRT